MDPNNFVLEISSDEDGDWNDHVRGVSDDGDDCNWFAELFGDGSDEVVVVSEAEKPMKKAKLKSCVVDKDDDCVLLDGDPNAPVDVRSDNPGNGDDDSDDVLVVSEKGQVACRDYPHSRHLCIKFPFSSTPNQTHCNQCYCYVCDSLAPCVFWGNGTATADHCHATDKDEFWILKRKNAKNGYKVDQPVTQPPPFDLQISPPPVPSHLQTPNPGPIHAPQTPTNFLFPDFASRCKHALASRINLHQDLTTRFAVSAQKKMYNSNYIVQRPVFKRTGTGTGISSVNKNLYRSYRGNLGNLSTPNVNGMLLRSSKTLQQNPILTLSTVNHPQLPISNQPNPNFQSSNVNSNNLFGTTRCQQPLKPRNLFPQKSFMPQPPSGSSNIGVPAQPSYSFLSKTTPLVDNPVVPNLTPNFSSGNQAPDPVTGPITGHAVDTGFKDYGLGWSAGQDTATRESTNSSSLETGGLGDYRYDWVFDDQPMEPGFTDYSSDSTAFIDTGPIFDFK